MARASRTTIRSLAAACFAAALAIPCTAASQAFPSKPIRLVTPTPPGGAPDVLARMVADKMPGLIGQPLVVENRTGANGVIGADLVARAAPDGYTLLLASNSTHVTPVFLTSNLPYDPVADFTPVINLVETTLYLVVNPSVPANTLQELIEHARRNPGKLSYGSNGIGSIYQLSGETIKMLTGIDIVHVPYKGSAAALNDLVANRVQVGFAGYAIQSYVKAGKLKILAVLDTRRFPRTPDIAAMSEAIPGYRKLAVWIAIMGPAKMPRPVLDRLNTEFAKALASPDVHAKLTEGGFVIIGDKPEEFAARLAADIELTGRVVKAIGLKPE